MQSNAMQSFICFTLHILMLQGSVWGANLGNFNAEAYFKAYGNVLNSSNEIPNDTLSHVNENVDINNGSNYRIEDATLESSSELLSKDSSQNRQPNSTFTTTAPPHPSTSATDTLPNTISTHRVVTLTEIFGNETHPPTSTQYHSSSSSSGSTVGRTQSNNSVTDANQGTGGSFLTTEDNEPEGVIRGTPSTPESINITASQPDSLYQKTLALISDRYTLSILVPVAAGIVLASTIIVLIATCRCLRRRCRRRRLRRKILPDSVKNFRPSDRARLLAESSDEEF